MLQNAETSIRKIKRDNELLQFIAKYRMLSASTEEQNSFFSEE